MLSGGHLVVFGFGENAQPPQGFVQILHVGGNPGPDGAKVMVVQLLSLGGRGAKQGPAGETQVLPLGEILFGDEEILLLRAHRGNDPLGFGVSKEPQDSDGLPAHFVDGAQERSLFIQCGSGIGEEAGGDV